jgi:aminoglycoside 6-adenylyltransferase
VKKVDQFYKNFEEAFKKWAEKTEDVRAAFVVGSRARIDHPADQWADLDIMMYARNHETYLSNIDWLKKFGNIWLTLTYQTSSGEPERLTLFEGGFQVDIVILPSNNLLQMVKDKITPDSFYRGVKILIDKDRVGHHLVPSTHKTKRPAEIRESDFTQVINMFLFGALYVAKQIMRGELWLVKAREQDLKNLLLQMLEWHAKTKHGIDYDVCHAGRFLEEWVDPETLVELPNTFSLYEKADSFRALRATLNLFCRLAMEIAQKLQFEYPTEVVERITNWIEEHVSI